MAGFTWTAPPQTVWPKGAEALARSIRVGIYAVIQKWAAILQNEMRLNAPWEDRTSNARQGLYTSIDPPSAAEIATVIELYLYQTVEYGPFLEGVDPRHNFSPTAQGDRYAIINPTIDAASPRIMADLRRMLS